MSRFPAIDVGPLPIELVNTVLRCALKPGLVHFSAANQDHAFDRHGEEFLACAPHVAAAVLAPEYIGQSPHLEGFEMVRRVDQIPGGYVLVALTLQADEFGRYRVQSVYPINAGALNSRLRKRRLFRTFRN